MHSFIQQTMCNACCELTKVPSFMCGYLNASNNSKNVLDPSKYFYFTWKQLISAESTPFQVNNVSLLEYKLFTCFLLGSK